MDTIKEEIIEHEKMRAMRQFPRPNYLAIGHDMHGQEIKESERQNEND